MDLAEMLAMAADPNTPAKALVSLLGKGEAIDRSLARSPKADEIENLMMAESSAEDPLLELPPAFLHELVLKRLDEFVASRDSPIARKAAAKYSSVTRPFVGASFVEQDRADASQRVSDMVGGFPFTSSSHPWPVTTGSGLHMQPIVQLDLRNAERLLGAPFGDRLLQVWGDVHQSVEKGSKSMQVKGVENVFTLRFIPPESLDEIASEFYPENAPWDAYDPVSAEPTDFFFMRLVSGDKIKCCPRIVWHKPMQMFGSLMHLYSLIYDSAVESNIGHDVGDEECELAEEMYEYISRSPLFPAYFQVYLGGFGGQAGDEQDPTYGGNLLIRLTDGDGFHLGVTYEKSRSGPIEYEIAWTLRV